MNGRFTALALLVVLPGLASTRAIEFNLEPEDDYYHDCNNNTLKLYLSNSKLMKGFMSSPTVKCLAVQGSYVADVENGAFDQMPNLQHLDLRRNRLVPSKLFAFGNLTSVRTLLLNDQNNYDGGATVWINEVYPQLRHLDLRNVSLQGFDSKYSDPFPQLRYLDLSGNSIRYTDFTSMLPQSMTHLLLNRNRIEEFYASNLDKLISLQLDDNKIQTLGDEHYSVQLFNCTSLKELSVANNKISAINPKIFNHTAQLRKLDLSYNSLSQLERDTVLSLKRLEDLALDGNFFEDIPATSMMNLTTLSMNCNKIERLTVNPFLNLPYLRKLYLGGNRITEVNAFTFRFQPRLEELHLNDNSLSHLPKDWGNNLNSLKLLDLSGNRFALLDSVVQSAPAGLMYVHFERNPMQYFNTGAIRSTVMNMTVYIRDEGRVASCKESSRGAVVDGEDKKRLEQLNATGLKDSEVPLNKTINSEASLALQSALSNDQSILVK